jgi:PAS domain S-box-containing protein
VPALQELMDNFYAVARFPMSIVDLEGKILVGVGWQDICTRFHRVHPETCKRCTESDIQLSAGVSQGEFRLYKCKNGLWDIATPLVVGGRQVGNIFSGQFFFDDETVDRESFRSQARRYGFDEEDYLAALDRVPRLSRGSVERGMTFLLKLADMLSQLGFSNARLSRLLAEQDRLTTTLHRQQESLKRAQEIAHLGSWELDLATNQITWSDEAYRIFGFEPGEIAPTYEEFLDLVHPDDREAVDTAYTGSIRDDRDSYDIEHRVVRKLTGEVRFVHERCHHIRDGSGKIVRSTGMVHDITDRRQAEKQSKEITEKYRHLVESSSSVILRTDKDMNIMFMNRYGLEYFGYAAEEVIGCNVLGTIIPEKGAAGEDLAAMLQDLTRNPDQYATSVQQYRRKDGTFVWMSWANRAIFDDAGKLVEILAIGNDLSKTKEAEEALRESEERLQEALRVSHSFAFEWTPATDRVHRSLSCAPLLGLKKEDAEADSGQQFFQRIHPQDRERFIAVLEGLRPDAVHYQGKYRYMRPDGGITVLEESGRGFFDAEGKLSRLIGITTDVTARERAEEALQQSEERFRLAIRHSKLMAWQCDAGMRFSWVYNSHFGIPDDELVGKTPSDLGQEADMTEFIAHGMGVLCEQSEVRRTIRIVQANGREQYFDQQIETVRDAGGNVVGLIGISLDVTDRELAEQRLHKSEEGFRLMIAHSAEPMLLVDETGRIECISSRGAQRLGYSDSELQGMNVDRLLDWSMKLDLTMRLGDFLRHAPVPVRAVLRVRTRTGQWCWVDVQASFVNYGQKPEKYLLKFELINTEPAK